MLTNLPHTLRRRLDGFLTRHTELYEKVLLWSGRGSLEKKIYLALIREDDVVFDIGANQGHFTLLFSDLVGANGEVHSFEPVPPTFQYLQQHLENERRFDNVFLNNSACSDQTGPVTIEMPGTDSGQASLRRHTRGSWQSQERITRFNTQTIMLDDYAKGRSSTEIDFVKCDVEGAELPALRGMESKLMRSLPILFLEVFSSWTGNFNYQPEDLFTFLRSIGYDRFYSATEELTPLKSDTPAGRGLGVGRSDNVLCAASVKHAARLQRLARMER